MTSEKLACDLLSRVNRASETIEGMVTKRVYWSDLARGKWRTMDEESEGFSFLFSKLCELSFRNEANIGWDIYRRPRYTDKRQKSLKLCLHETLFEELRAPWISELIRTRDRTEQKDDLRFNVYDKLSIAAFKLRIARRFDDAEKLEHFVCSWRNLQGESLK